MRSIALTLGRSCLNTIRAGQQLLLLQLQQLLHLGVARER